MVHDFHGYTSMQALNEAEMIIGRVRAAGETEYATFITGHGVIRDQLLQLLHDYDLEPSLQIGNNGAIIVTID